MHIGIDLGTTFCCVAYIDEGIPHVIPDNRGREITPSVIWFDGKTSYVGEEANKKKITVFAPILSFLKEIWVSLLKIYQENRRKHLMK